MTRPRRASGYTKPPGWTATIVPRILRRDRAVCYLCGRAGATSVDHVKPVAEGGSHDDANLAAVHPTPCHAAKTEQERQRAVTRRSRRRPSRTNPNLID